LADCELLSDCLFFNDRMETMPVTSELLKIRYCRGNNSRCARYILYLNLGRPRIPRDLYPTEMDRADDILGKK
jgi:hypothetical protein